MRREDDYWTIEFGGQTCRLRDTKGLRYLATLLRRPHEPLAALVIERGVAVGELAADYGAAERARINVTRALNGAIRRLDAFNPALVHHLRATLRTGAQCLYTPDPRVPITWEIPGD